MDLSEVSTRKLLAEINRRRYADLPIRINRLRLKMGMTLEEFGQQFNPPANKSNVKQWEKADNKPSPKRLAQLNELFERWSV